MFKPVNAMKISNDAVMACDCCVSCDDSNKCPSCNVAGDTK